MKKIVNIILLLLVITACTNKNDISDGNINDNGGNHNDRITIESESDLYLDAVDGKNYTCILEPSIRERYEPNGEIIQDPYYNDGKHPVYADCKCYEELDSKQIGEYTWIKINDNDYINKEDNYVWVGTKPDWIRKTTIYSKRDFSNPNLRFLYSEADIPTLNQYIELFGHYVGATEDEITIMKFLKRRVPGLLPGSSPFVDNMNFDNLKIDDLSIYLIQMDIYGLNGISFYDNKDKLSSYNLVNKYIDEERLRYYNVSWSYNEIDENGNSITRAKEDAIKDEMKYFSIYPQEQLDYYSYKYYGNIYDYDLYSKAAILYDSNDEYYAFPLGMYGFGSDDSYPYIKSIVKNNNELKVTFSYAPTSIYNENCVVDSNLSETYNYSPINDKEEILDFLKNKAKCCEAVLIENDNSYILKSIRKLNY